MSDWQQNGTPSTDLTWNDQFRADFPEFGHTSPETFTDESITFWYGVADKLLNVVRWGDLLTIGQQLFVAHNITLAYNNEQDFALGDKSGMSAGLVASNQSVGDVQVAYDLSIATEQDGGEYNSTIYGRKYIRLARMVGTGGYYV
jgi:hypothetical protein